ncbi:hypothetical protein EVAR_62875_1 [Eumeta japonica]|uniref:DUF5641 domain-containing protein n=1 Tax=Eumeta variegata TaxID=151549 RepID=A0A4C1Z0Y0_EUMVA|nr:hypothetical protein EVAR_62875_1 [Eumeta japonica]
MSLSNDFNGLPVLTFGHFLIGQPLNAVSEYPHCDMPISRLSRFQWLRQIMHNIWKRFQSEYLHTFQQRYKWADLAESPQVGDLVLIERDYVSPLQCQRGWISKLYPGRVDIVQVVDVRTPTSVLHRAGTSLTRLPIQQNTTDRRGGEREMRADVIRTRWSAVIGGTLLTRGRVIRQSYSTDYAQARRGSTVLLGTHSGS